MLCPVCEEPMVVVELDAVELDVCSACAGIWLDAEELDLLHATVQGGPDCADPAASLESELARFPGVRGARRRCPRCSGRMATVRVPGGAAPVEIDRCTEGDGLWFDRGELAELLAGSMGDDHPALGRVHAYLGRFAVPGEREGS